MNIERSDIAPESHSRALAGRRQQRTILVLDLAQHDLAGTRAQRERPQEIAVEASYARSKSFGAEWRR